MLNLKTIFVSLFVASLRLQALNLTEFEECISSAGPGLGYGTTCELDAGIWPVTQTLYIQRNGLTIQGTINDRHAAVLQRTASIGFKPVMEIDSGNLTVTVQWLTIDGNRNNVALCDTTDHSVADLDLFPAGKATVQFISLIRAPWRGIALGGSLGQGSSLSYSSIGQGFNAHGLNLSAPKTATRWTGIIFGGDYTGVWHNNIAYVGLAAIHDYAGNYQYIVGNQMHGNRYEQPDGVSGGADLCGRPANVFERCR